jgi:hypothetical protein
MFVVDALSPKRPRRWRRKPETLRTSVETAGPDRDDEDLPRKAKHAHDGRLVVEGERPTRPRPCA